MTTNKGKYEHHFEEELDSSKEGINSSEGPIKMSLRALLIERNIKQIDIARKYFIDPSEVNKVVLGKRSTPRIREAIAKELHLNPQDIWKDV